MNWSFQLPLVRGTVFLAAVLAVRLLWLGVLGPEVYVPGNNSRTAVEAKLLLTHGVGAASVSTPPGPILLLAGFARGLNLPPGDALPWLLLGGHALLALAFWFWLRSLQLPRPVELAGLAIFLFLPILNSYEGFDNAVVLWAAAAFLTIAWAFRQWLRDDARRARTGWAALMCASGFALLLLRSEYLAYVPIWLAVYLVPQLIRRRRLDLAPLVGCGLLLVSMAAGAVASMAFRHADSGQFALNRPGYTVFTFLDGTPDRWLSEDDRTDIDRFRRGAEIFGAPADHDYSLARMILAHPGRTVVKYVLNLPRWAVELGRRHVVVPLPVTALALLGLAALLAGRIRTADDLPPLLVGMIAMTLPLALLIIYAEYMMPAFAAVAVLAACGLVWLFDVARRAVAGRASPAVEQSAWWVALAGTCLAMQLLLLRGGGTLPDAVSLRPLAQLLDELAADHPAPMLLAPYRVEIDCLTRADIRNRWVVNQRTRRGPPSEPAEDQLGYVQPLTAVDALLAPELQAVDLDYVAVWGPTGGAELLETLAQWHTLGFGVVASGTTSAEGYGQLSLYLMRRER